MRGSFEYYRPGRLDEAVSVLLESGGRAALLAGGTDLVPRLKRSERAVDVLVDLGGLRELSGLEPTARGLHIGALATAGEIARDPVARDRFPALAEAARLVGAMQVRNMATLGGALCSGLRCQYHDQSQFWRGANGPCPRDGLGLCHATGEGRCVGTQASDLPVALAALEAEVQVRGPEGARTLSVSELQDGEPLRHLALAPGELVTGALVPWRASRLVSTYRKLRLRKAVDRPLLGLAVAVDFDEEGLVRALRVAACGVGPAVRLAPGLESFAGCRLDRPLAEAAARAVERWIRPSPALRVDPLWRRAMARVLVGRALVGLAERARTGESVPASRHGADPATEV